MTLSPGDSAVSRPIHSEATNNFDQLVVVLMENHDLADIYGPATYMTQLADQYGLAQHWESITNPSQPNYIALIGGSTFGVSGDGNSPNLNHPTIVDIIEASGHTWKAFAEDASGSGCGLNPPRGEDHFPFLSYTTITGNSARCANLLPGSSNEVIAALNAGTNFIWLTPNDCNNMHSCGVSRRILRRRRPRGPGLFDRGKPCKRFLHPGSIRDFDDQPSVDRRFHRERRADDRLFSRGSDRVLFAVDGQRESDIDVHLDWHDGGLIRRHGDRPEHIPHSHNVVFRGGDDDSAAGWRPSGRPRPAPVALFAG